MVMTETTDPVATRSGRRLHRVSVKFGGLGRPLAGTRWLRLYAVLRHVGRRSGRTYEIPIVAFPTIDGFLIPLPFGESTQWLKNLEAAETAGLRRAGHDFAIERPSVVPLDTLTTELPRPIRFVARRVGIDQFVRVHRAT
jgi:deazaflavin-dependent oxidoreductase (nitroreductase family)